MHDRIVNTSINWQLAGYFRKMLYLRCLTGFLLRLWNYLAPQSIYIIDRQKKMLFCARNNAFVPICSYPLKREVPREVVLFIKKNLTKVKCEASKKKNIQWCLFYFIIKKQIFQSDTTCCVKQFRERIQFSIQFTRIFWPSKKNYRSGIQPLK